MPERLETKRCINALYPFLFSLLCNDWTLKPPGYKVLSWCYLCACDCCVSRYSCTEGKTWENYTLPLNQRRIKADGLLNEPGIMSLITRWTPAIIRTTSLYFTLSFSSCPWTDWYTIWRIECLPGRNQLWQIVSIGYRVSAGQHSRSYDFIEQSLQ